MDVVVISLNSPALNTLIVIVSGSIRAGSGRKKLLRPAGWKPVAFVQGRLHGIGVGLCIVGNPYEERTEDRCEDADTGNG